MFRHSVRLALSCSLLSILLAAAGRAAAGELQQPKGSWQVPGEIQQPKGTWQVPGEIQVPKGIQAIQVREEKCERRLCIGSDTLFEFDRATLTADAAETLAALGPMIAKAGRHPVRVEGHTDAVGGDAYNQSLSEARARTVRTWLVEHRFVPESAATVGWGEKRPMAPNTKPDGSDDPAGRAHNRRVEVVIDTCE